jgi:hypothetical protein
MVNEAEVCLIQDQKRSCFGGSFGQPTHIGFLKIYSGRVIGVAYKY